MRSDLSAEYQLSKKFIIYTTVRNLQSAAIRNDRYNSQTPRYTRPTNYQFGLTDFAFGVRGEF